MIYNELIKDSFVDTVMRGWIVWGGRKSVGQDERLGGVFCSDLHFFWKIILQNIFGIFYYYGMNRRVRRMRKPRVTCHIIIFTFFPWQRKCYKWGHGMFTGKWWSLQVKGKISCAPVLQNYFSSWPITLASGEFTIISYTTF